MATTTMTFKAQDIIVSGAITLASSGNNTKEIFDIERNVNLKYKGGAGSETFNINITER